MKNIHHTRSYEMSKLSPMMLVDTPNSFSEQQIKNLCKFLSLRKCLTTLYLMHSGTGIDQLLGNWSLKGHTQADGMYGPAVGSHWLEAEHTSNSQQVLIVSC